MDRGELVRLAENRLGRQLKGKWILNALLGVGGTAAVYSATHHRNGKRVAIKVLHPGKTSSRSQLGRFLREGYAANRIGHAGVVTVHDDDVDEDGSPFLIQELVDGVSLEQHRLERGGKLPVREALLIGAQLLEALAAAHASGIVHRDIKPANLLLRADGLLKVVDFGAARLSEQTREATDTEDGCLLGTPAFMAPEQARGAWHVVDSRTDIWAVGATLFVLLSGRPVHEGANVQEVLSRALTRSPPPLSSLVPDVPGAVAAVVDKALRYEMHDRFRSAGEMQSELLRVLEELGRTPLVPGAGVLRQTEPQEATLSCNSCAVPKVVEPNSPARTPKRQSAPRSSEVLRVTGAIGAAAFIGLGVTWLSDGSTGSKHAIPSQLGKASPIAGSVAKRLASGWPSRLPLPGPLPNPSRVGLASPASTVPAGNTRLRPLRHNAPNRTAAVVVTSEPPSSLPQFERTQVSSPAPEVRASPETSRGPLDRRR